MRRVEVDNRGFHPDGAGKALFEHETMQPLDKASAEFDLAQAYFDAGQEDKAEENVLAALEAAPTYRPAQKLLMQLEDSKKGTNTDGHPQ